MINKWLVSKVTKQLMQLNINKQKKKINNGQKTWIDNFPKMIYR